MLKIREPIKLKNTNIVTGSDSFALSLLENYEKRDVSLNAQELMHLITTSPDIIYSEGDNTNYFTSNLRIENITEQRIEILNNLINRIMLTANGKLSYRDRVYISGYLTKLGITNQQMFMKNVNEVLTEHRSSIEMLSSMQEKVDYISNVYPEVIKRLEENAKSKADASNKDTKELFLHERIFDRLGTERIYDTLWKYKEINSHSERISSGELLIAEQHKNSRYMELNRIQTRILGTALPLEFYHQDVYEQQLIESLQSLTEEEITQSLTQASLLSILEKVYESRDTYINEQKRVVLDVENLYSTVENTFDRYVENIYSPQLHNVVYNSEISQVATQVLNFLEQQYALDNKNPENAEETKRIDAERIEKTNVENMFNRYVENISSPQFRGAVYNTEISQVATQALDFIKEQSAPEEKEPKITEETIRRDVERIERTNIESKNRYILAMQQLEKRLNSEKTAMPSSAVRRQESLEALNDPTELLHRYETEHTERIERESRIRTEALEKMSPITRRYVELIDRYIINPSPEDRAIMEKTDPFASLTRDILSVERILPGNGDTVSEISDENINFVKETIKRVKGETEHVESKLSTNEMSRKTSMVHKIQETINEAEILERIEEIRNMTKETSSVVNEAEETRVVKNNLRTTEQVTENIDQNKLKEMVRTQVTGQMGELSEQVFRRLENKLANEKRRRGY